MRRLSLLALLWLAACTPYYQPPGPNVVPSMMVYVEVSDASDGHPLLAAVRYWFKDSVDTALVQDTKADGTTAYIVPAKTTDSHMWVQATGYVPMDKHVSAGPGVIIKFALQKIPPPIVRKTRDEVKAVQTNFLNLHDATGRPQFSPFIGGMPVDRQLDWIANEVKAGSTHLVISVDVNGYGALTDPALRLTNFYIEDRWSDFKDLLTRVMAARLTPILFLHSGDTYAGDAYFRGICGWWNQHFGDLTDQVLMVNGWETRRFGGLTAFEFNRANTIMREVLGPTAILAFHGSPETGLFGSGDPPRESDDPWATVGEPENWTTHSGKEFEVFLYQTMNLPNDKLDPYGQPAWWDRTADTVERFLPGGTPLPGLVGVKTGQHDGGWHYRSGVAGPDWFGGKRERGRPVLVAFEYSAWGYIRGLLTDAEVTAIADKLYSFGFRYFGNGARR